MADEVKEIIEKGRYRFVGIEDDGKGNIKSIIVTVDGERIECIGDVFRDRVVYVVKREVVKWSSRRSRSV